MIYSPQDLLGTTESLLKYDEDERLSEASPQHLHNALGRAVMIAVGDNWAKSRARRAGKRKAYYLSAEYLVGRLVYNNLFNLGILDEMRRVFAERGIDLACLEEIEDAALGNGGLGRLAACYMDSAATCGVPLSVRLYFQFSKYPALSILWSSWIIRASLTFSYTRAVNCPWSMWSKNPLMSPSTNHRTPG